MSRKLAKYAKLPRKGLLRAAIFKQLWQSGVTNPEEVDMLLRKTLQVLATPELVAWFGRVVRYIGSKPDLWDKARKEYTETT